MGSAGSVSSDVERRIHKIHILLVKLLAKQFHSFSEALEVDYFTFPEELDHIIYIRVVGEPENIVVSDSRLLFGPQILAQIRHRIPLDLHHASVIHRTRRSRWVHASSVIYKVRGKCTVLNLTVLQIPSQLVHDCTYHFKVTQFFCT